MSTSTMTPETAAEPAKKGKGKLIIILVGVLAAGAAAYFFLLAPGDGKKPAAEPGEVVALEPIQINLAEGHYLRLGLALQLTADVKHEADGSKALDAAIELFSGKEMVELSQSHGRHELKKELSKELKHLYHGEVMEVYFTDFVTQ